MAVTSYGHNKNHDDEIKKYQEKANNSPSYRCAAINDRKFFLKKMKLIVNFNEILLKIVVLIISKSFLCL